MTYLAYPQVYARIAMSAMPKAMIAKFAPPVLIASFDSSGNRLEPGTLEAVPNGRAVPVPVPATP